MAAETTEAIVEAIRSLDDDAKAAIGRELAPHIPMTLGRRQLLGLGGIAALGAATPTAAQAATRAAIEPAAAAQGVINDIDDLQSGDGTPIDVLDPLALADIFSFNHAVVSSATTVSDANFIEYDTSAAGFTLTLGSALEVRGLPVILQDKGGAAGTNALTVDTQSANNINGGASISINHDNAVTIIVWNGTEWRTHWFTDTVDARTIVTGSIGNGGSDVSVTDNLEMNDNEAKNLVLHQVSGDPSTPVTGQIWYDTSAD